MDTDVEGLKKDWIVIGISGVTCGGKTTLANRLKETLTPTVVLHQDAYFYPDSSPKHVRCADLPHNNYDILSALDMAALLADSRRVLRGAPGPAGPGGLRAGARGFLIIEGFSVLNDKPFMELCDLRYYLTLEYSECMARRALRLYEPPDVEGYFERCVWPQHLIYRAEIEKDRRVRMLDGTQQDALDIVLADIGALHALTECGPGTSGTQL